VTWDTANQHSEATREGLLARDAVGPPNAAGSKEGSFHAPPALCLSALSFGIVLMLSFIHTSRFGTRYIFIREKMDLGRM
jgi:hypothetical protein